MWNLWFKLQDGIDRLKTRVTTAEGNISTHNNRLNTDDIILNEHIKKIERIEEELTVENMRFERLTDDTTLRYGGSQAGTARSIYCKDLDTIFVCTNIGMLKYNKDNNTFTNINSSEFTEIIFNSQKNSYMFDTQHTSQIMAIYYDNYIYYIATNRYMYKMNINNGNLTQVKSTEVLSNTYKCMPGIIDNKICYIYGYVGNSGISSFTVQLIDPLTSVKTTYFTSSRVLSIDEYKYWTVYDNKLYSSFVNTGSTYGTVYVHTIKNNDVVRTSYNANAIRSSREPYILGIYNGYFCYVARIDENKYISPSSTANNSFAIYKIPINYIGKNYEAIPIIHHFHTNLGSGSKISLNDVSGDDIGIKHKLFIFNTGTDGMYPNYILLSYFYKYKCDNFICYPYDNYGFMIYKLTY